MRNLLDERLREITNYYEIRYNQNKSELSKDVDQIRIDLDRQYARGNVQVLNEAKAILLESVHFSFSVLQENLSELIKKNSTDPKNLQKLVNDRLKLAKIKHSHITRLLNLIDGYKFIPLFMPATKPVREKKQDYFTTIEDAAVNSESLADMYQILIDAQLIDEETKIIKDSEKGHKGYFYTTIQKFFEKGYFKRKPSVEEYLNICNNSFSVSVSKHTASNIKTIKRSNLPIPSFHTK